MHVNRLLVGVQQIDQQRGKRAFVENIRHVAVAWAMPRTAAAMCKYHHAARRNRGDAAASVPVLIRVVEKAPDQAIARYHLGMAQSQAGDSSDARDNLLRAVNSGAQFSGLDEAKATLEKLAKLPLAASSPKT